MMTAHLQSSCLQLDRARPVVAKAALLILEHRIEDMEMQIIIHVVATMSTGGGGGGKGAVAGSKVS